MSRVFFLPSDVVKRANPVCHFVTPLDGNMELDINRTTEVLEELSCHIVHKSALCIKQLSFILSLTLTSCSVNFPFLISFFVLGVCCKHCATITSPVFLLQVNGTEGKCWKRRIEIVIREYHKWRTYFKKRVLYSINTGCDS